MITCLIFDLDGTLLNTLEDLCDSVNFALSKFGYPEKSLEEVRCAVGNGVNVLFERVLPEGKCNPNFDLVVTTFKDNYKNNMCNKTKPYEGIIEVLKVLKDKGIQTAVVSNKFDDAVKSLCKRYFGDLIQVAIGENELAGIRKKPAPDSVFKVIEELHVDVEKVLYVGDSETDVQTAKNAEIGCIGCIWGFRDKNILQNEGARYIIESPKEILDIVK